MRTRTRTAAAGLALGRALATACLTLALGGCCAVNSWYCRTPGSLRIPIPEPYLLVRAAESGAPLDAQIVYLPRPDREMRVRPGPWAGDDYDVELTEGGFLARVSGQAEVGLRPRVSLPTKSSAGRPEPQPMGDRPLRPGLYKLVWTADPLPDLIPVTFFAEPRQAPTRPVVGYRPVAGQPEIVEEILIQLDGGDAEAIAGQVRVYRGEVEVTDDCTFERRGDAIAVGLPPAYRDSFAPYRVLIEPLSFEAPLPAEDEIAALQPRATIRAADSGGRRFAIDYEPRRGSAVDLEQTVETVQLDGRGPESGRFRVRADGPTRHLLELADEIAGPVTLAVTPVNLAGLAGETTVLRWEASPPTPPPPPSDPAVVDASLSGPFDDQLVFGLEIEDPDRRVDLPRTEGENHIRQSWSSVACSRQQGRVRCGGRFSVRGEVPDFAVYCVGRPGAPCLTAEVTVRR